MPSLHESTELTKKAVLFGTIGVFGLILIVIIISNLLKLFKSPPPPPSLCYGKITAPAFPQSIDTSAHTFTLNTLSGSLPSFSDRVIVPKYQDPTPSLLGLSNASASAAADGFNDPPTYLTDNTYIWNKSSTINKTLTINTLTHNFSLDSDYLSNPSVIGAQSLPSIADTVGLAQNFYGNILSTLGDSIPEDIDINNPQFTYFIIQNNEQTPVENADFPYQLIRLDFPHSPISNCYKDQNGNNQSCKIYYQDYNSSLVNITFGSETQVNDNDFPTLNIVKAEYFSKPLSQNPCGDGSTQPTYPLISPQQAFNMLKQGDPRTSIVSYSGNTKNINITDVKLGYYQTDDESQNYLWPIYVFIGDHNFAAYVSAITGANGQM